MRKIRRKINEDGKLIKDETMKKTSPRKEGVGGADIVKKNPTMRKNDTKGLSSIRPRIIDNIRVLKKEYLTPTREKRRGEENPWKTIINRIVLNLEKVETTTIIGIAII